MKFHKSLSVSGISKYKPGIVLSTLLFYSYNAYSDYER